MSGPCGVSKKSADFCFPSEPCQHQSDDGPAAQVDARKLLPARLRGEAQRAGICCLREVQCSIPRVEGVVVHPGPPTPLSLLCWPLSPSPLRLHLPQSSVHISLPVVFHVLLFGMVLSSLASSCGLFAPFQRVASASYCPPPNFCPLPGTIAAAHKCTDIAYKRLVAGTARPDACPGYMHTKDNVLEADGGKTAATIFALFKPCFLPPHLLCGYCFSWFLSSWEATFYLVFPRLL